MATILYPDKFSEKIDDESIKGLREQQTIVGGYIEYIYLENGKVLIVDEEGMMKHLLMNMEASLIANRQILGTAILCDQGVLE